MDAPETPNGHGHSHAENRREVPFGTGKNATRVLAMTSGKGGVGKSSVSVNVAVALAQMGRRVAIIDADVYGFSVPKMLGVTEEPSVVDHVITPPIAHGVQCMSIGFFIDEDKPVMWRGPMLHKALEQFLVDVAWGELDYVIVDMPPGTGDVAMSMAKYLPAAETFVVTTPQPAAQRVAQRSGAMAKELRMELAGVIENMSFFVGDDGVRYELFGNGGGQQLSDALGVPLMAQLPLSVALREGGDAGAPIVEADPHSDAAVAVRDLAAKIDSSKPHRRYRPELRVS